VRVARFAFEGADGLDEPLLRVGRLDGEQSIEELGNLCSPRIASVSKACLSRKISAGAAPGRAAAAPAAGAVGFAAGVA
jgi:hypothetical protein